MHVLNIVLLKRLRSISLQGKTAVTRKWERQLNHDSCYEIFKSFYENLPSPCTQMLHTFTFLLVPAAAGGAAGNNDFERRDFRRAGFLGLGVVITIRAG